jgi:para-nitrobenzyl esterase
MKWVNEHIASFGGDKAAVTLFGESAGGNAVINHLVTPDSFPLYRSAIVMSGAYSKGAIPMEKAAAVFTDLLDRVRCADVACLRSVPEKDLLESFPEEFPDGPTWGPVVDGVELTGFPTDLIEAGTYNNKVRTHAHLYFTCRGCLLHDHVHNE